MADVRSLLRNEQASRRVKHLHASYTDSGKLLCSLCGVQIKTESLWPSHVKSPQHAIRLQRLQDVSPVPSKKRKADDSDDDGRKRTKGTPDAEESEPPEKSNASAAPEHKGPRIEITAPADEDVSTRAPIATGSPSSALSNAQPAEEEDEEWLAFQREVAAAPTAITPASATISAAPMTAEEVAAQAREEQSVQRGRNDVEVEGEREDAARALEEEFEEMDGLEQRVRKLREKREALRRLSVTEATTARPDVTTPSEATVNGAAEEVAEASSSEDDEDDLDEWTFGAA